VWRGPPVDRAIADVAAYVQATWAPLGVVVAGSIVRGEADPASDLDVFVVHDQPWRLREQRRFAGVPVELFVNPPAQVRRYFAREHADGRPCTAHMFATGEVLVAHPVIDELIAEARDWLARTIATTTEQLTQQRYQAVDLIDDARDTLGRDPAAASLMLAAAVGRIVEHAFWRAGAPQPRRKQAVAALAALDPIAAALVRRWSASTGAEALAVVEELARHVLGVDTFFEWTSARDPVEP